MCTSPKICSHLIGKRALYRSSALLRNHCHYAYNTELHPNTLEDKCSEDYCQIMLLAVLCLTIVLLLEHSMLFPAFAALEISKNFQSHHVLQNSPSQ